MTEGEMVGWHHRFNGHELEKTSGESEGQASLSRCNPWSCKEPLNKDNWEDSTCLGAIELRGYD